MKYILVLDIDETLTSDVSWLTFTKGLDSDPERLLNIFNEFKKGNISLIEAKKQVLNLWKVNGEITLNKCSKIFEKVNFKEGVFELISKIKSDFTNIDIVLLSGSFDLFVKEVANELNINDYLYNSKLLFDAESKLIDFEYIPNQIEHKKSQLIQYIQDKYNKNDLPKIIALGDGENDQEVFNLSDYSIIINSLDNKNLNVNFSIKSVTEILPILYEIIKNE